MCSACRTGATVSQNLGTVIKDMGPVGTRIENPDVNYAKLAESMAGGQLRRSATLRTRARPQARGRSRSRAASRRWRRRFAAALRGM